MNRRMKKDRKFFLGRLSCKISRIKRDNRVQELRGKLGMEREEEKEMAKPLTPYLPKTSPSQFSYAEMIPGSPPHQFSPTSNSLSLSLFIWALLQFSPLRCNIFRSSLSLLINVKIG